MQMSFKAASSPVRSNAAVRSANRRIGPVVVKALFGFGQKDDSDKEEQFKLQQELLAKRKTGEAIKEASVRRAAVKQTLAARKAERKAERDALAQGIMPETLKNWKPYQKKEDAEGTSGIVVPLLPFGRVQYDEGERFDLRSPYSDDGWVDPNETSLMDSLKNFFKKTVAPVEDQQGKPILWASDYAKMKREQAGSDDKNKKRK